MNTSATRAAKRVLESNEDIVSTNALFAMDRAEAIRATRNTRACTIDTVMAWRKHLEDERARWGIDQRSHSELVSAIARKSGITEHETSAILVLYRGRP